MEKVTEDDNKELIINLRYRVLIDSGDGLLLQYIQNYQVLRAKELILNTLRMFWLPLAYKESGLYSDEEIKNLGKKSVYWLEKQADYICFELGLNPMCEPQDKSPLLELHAEEQRKKDEEFLQSISQKQEKKIFQFNDIGFE